MNLFLIENDKSVHLVRANDVYSKGKDIVLCFNYLPYLTLQRFNGGDNFFFIEELLNEDDYNKLHCAVDEFAMTWYLSDGKDLTFYSNISYGNVVRGMFSRTYFTSILVKYGEIIRKAKEMWPEIKAVYCDFSNKNNSFFFRENDNGRFFNKRLLVEIVCKQLQLNYQFIEPDIYIPSVFIVRRSSDKGDASIAKKIYDFNKRILKWVRYNALFSLASGEKIYLFSYFNIDNILSNTNGQFILSSLSESKHLLTRPLSYLRFNDVPFRLGNKQRGFFKILQQMFLSDSAHFGSDFTFNGICYSDIYKPAIHELVVNVIPGLLVFAGQVSKAIKKCRIKKIVILEEIEDIIRVLIEVCRIEGVQTIFLDHGIQGHNHAQKVFDRNKSDVVICPGSFYVQYYQSLNPEYRQCVVLGNPSMDHYPSVKRKTVSNIKKILFLTFEDNFYARLDRFAYQEKYYKEIFSIFNELHNMGIEIFYKTHFEERLYHEYLFNFFDIDPVMINYIEGSSFSKIIYDMDMMVCNVSTCFYEAQAAGVPTIFMEPCFMKDAQLPPLNGENGVEVLRVSGGRELLEIIKSNQHDPYYLNRFLENFLKIHAPIYMGKLDGMASKRISNFLSQNN